MNGKESFVQPLSNREDAEPNPLIVPGKGKFIRVYPWNMTLLPALRAACLSAR